MQHRRHEPVGTAAPTGQGTVTTTVPGMTPSSIIETTFTFAESCILLAAVELNLFTWIGRGVETPEQLAESAQVSEPALIRLLGALAAMGFLRRTTNGYTLTPLSERYLVRDRETYIGDVVLQIRQEWDAWGKLTDIVRTGQPARYINEEPLGGHFFEPLVEYLFPLVYPVMRRICDRLEVGASARGLQVIDLGAGAAPGAIAALELDPDAHAVVVDFPGVLGRAQAHAREWGVESRMEYWPTALDALELPPMRFDLAIASHIFRIVGADLTRRLIDQCYQALTPGGRLVVVETYNDPDDEGKLFPHIVALNMLVNTRSGDAFSSHQVREWLHAAGFQVDVWRGVGPDLVLVATRL